MLCLNAQYGFKNSPRSFRLSLDKKLKQIGLVPSVQDDCLYTMEHPEHGTLRLAVWVDDVVLLSKDRAGYSVNHIPARFTRFNRAEALNLSSHANM